MGRYSPHSSRKAGRICFKSYNDRGKHKAKVFEHALGFTQENYQLLLVQIEKQVFDAAITIIKIDHYGQHVRTDIEVIGINGQVAFVRIGWLIPGNSRQARLVTLYVRKE